MEPLDQQANYLLCVATGPEKSLGLAWADISTSDFYVRTYRDVGRGFLINNNTIARCPSIFVSLKKKIECTYNARNSSQSPDKIQSIVRRTFFFLF